jgi:endonuclease YncB( thermonuclease family)
MGHHFSLENSTCCVALATFFSHTDHVVQPEQQEQQPQEQPYVIDPYHGATDENTPYDTVEGLKTRIKVLRVLDGDTLDVGMCRDGRTVLKYRVRLYGIDTPEKRPSRSDPLRHLEIEASLRSKQALTDRLMENDWIVIAHFDKPDKYGRLLCTLFDKNGENLNEWMIRMGHAVAYFGKTKKKFQAEPVMTAKEPVAAKESIMTAEEPPSSEEEFEDLAAS